MINLKNRIALVTGGSRGIGSACAILFAKAGANVAITYKDNEKAANKVVRKIKSLNKTAIELKCDIENYQDVYANVKEVVNYFGRIDILVNNAGVWTESSLENMSEQIWDETIDINLKGTMNFCKAVLPYMKRQKYGRIINISSTAGQRGEAFHSHYAAAKGGVISFTKSIAVELIKYGIYVNCVAPGWVLTDMTNPFLKVKKNMEKVLKTIPRNKIATPDEIAGPVLFLASDLSNNIVGEILNVNGGSVLCG
ncbi:MAG: 3-oxoacyl-[acyl-carrier protein] reductase [Ignavibacteriae bacterium]|nr:MAG: 3-oxoacyl-[acyl-carrier protein] reductase [Ignavibacteriota bacterium]